jgi:hypothetical protein
MRGTLYKEEHVTKWNGSAHNSITHFDVAAVSVSPSILCRIFGCYQRIIKNNKRLSTKSCNSDLFLEELDSLGFEDGNVEERDGVNIDRNSLRLEIDENSIPSELCPVCCCSGAADADIGDDQKDDIGVDNNDARIELNDCTKFLSNWTHV